MAGVPFFFKQSAGFRAGSGVVLDGVITDAFPATLSNQETNP
jgi:hypothetical protein